MPSDMGSMGSLSLTASISAGTIFIAIWRYLAARSRAARRAAMLAGKSALVTGASSGIGAELTKLLAQQRKMRLTLAARGEKDLQRTSEELCDGSAHTVRTDVTDRAQCDAMVASAVAKHGGLDLLVVCAGAGHHGPCADDDTEMQHRLMNVNYFGAINCIKAALPHLIKSKGQILVIGSLSGEVGLPMRTAYCASKFALHGFIEAMRIELKMLDVHVGITVAAPSSVDTPFRKHNIGKRPKMQPHTCAELALKGLDRAERVTFIPGHYGLMKNLLPRSWTDYLIAKNQRGFFNALKQHYAAEQGKL